ncbi:MAG: ATPase [Chloroflexi bacterium]|nr:ATPase [Chloroflexota bacterium]
MNPIDILHLIDRLEDLLEHGWRLPLGNKVAIDQDMFLNIIDQMRIVIPQEIKQAREVQQERDRYVAQAHEEARRIIAQAREDAARQLDEHKLRKAADAQAEAIIQRAQQEASRIRSGADEYAEAKLKELAGNLSQLQRVIENGLDLLESRRAQYLEQAAAEASREPTPHVALIKDDSEAQTAAQSQAG